MHDKVFEGVADTLYIPLAARVYVSKNFPEYFFDPKSLELEPAIPGESIQKGSNEYTNKYVKKTGNASALMYCAIDDPAAFAREAGCELLEVRSFYTTARRILRGKVNLYSKVAMAITDRTGRAFLMHMKL